MSATRAEAKSAEAASFGQARQVLDLITDQDPTKVQIDNLLAKGWVFKHLLRLDPGKIDRYAFCCAIGAPLYVTRGVFEVGFNPGVSLPEVFQQNKGFFHYCDDCKLFLLDQISPSLDYQPNPATSPVRIHIVRPTVEFAMEKFFALLEQQNLFPLGNIQAFIALLRQNHQHLSPGFTQMPQYIPFEGLGPRRFWYNTYNDAKEKHLCLFRNPGFPEEQECDDGTEYAFFEKI